MKASFGDTKPESTEIQKEYGPSVIEMAPFFTSLHVNDAGKPGLMTNRLALHEQFTVSPQRFAQMSAPCRSSSAPHSCSEECVLNGCHHLHTSHMPIAPESSKAQGFACPFFGTMEDITVYASKSADNNTLLDIVAMNPKRDRLKHVVAKTVDVQLPSSHTTLDKAESNDGHSVCDSPAVDVMKLVKGAQYLSIADKLQRVSDLKHAGLTRQSEGCVCVGYESAEDGGKISVKDDVVLTVSKKDQDKLCKEHDRRMSNEGCSNSTEIKNPQFKASDTKGLDSSMPNDEVTDPCSAEQYRVVMEDNLEHWKESSSDASGACDNLIGSSSICNMEVGTALPNRDIDVSTTPPEVFSSILNTSHIENTGKAGKKVSCFPVRNKSGACGGYAKDSCGVAESSREDIAMGNSSNNLEACCPLSLSPKAVINKIGQLRFWKARLALIRQQRIFSDQVFELHKLIEVQRLLAGTPCTSMDEVYFGVGNMKLDCNGDALAPNDYLADKSEIVGDSLGKQILTLESAVECPIVVAEAEMKSINLPA